MAFSPIATSLSPYIVAPSLQKFFAFAFVAKTSASMQAKYPLLQIFEIPKPLPTTVFLVLSLDEAISLTTTHLLPRDLSLKILFIFESFVK